MMNREAAEALADEFEEAAKEVARATAGAPYGLWADTAVADIQKVRDRVLHALTGEGPGLEDSRPKWRIRDSDEEVHAVQHLDGTDAGWVTYAPSDTYQPNRPYLRHLPPGSPEVFLLNPNDE